MPALPGLRELFDIAYLLILPLNPPYYSGFFLTHTSKGKLFTLKVRLNEDTYKVGVKQENATAILLVMPDATQLPS